MDKKKFDELTDLLAQDLKTEKDVSAMTRMLSGNGKLFSPLFGN